MNKLFSGLMAAVISMSFAVSLVMPVNAAPRVAPSVPTASQDVQKVQDYRWRRGGERWRGGNRWRGGRDWSNSDHMRYSLGERRFDRRGDWRRSDFRRGERWGRDDYRHWRGHRGYRHWRRGYRERNGWWFPLAAFTAGAVIGNVINEPRVYEPRVYRDGGGHTQWCYNRYRSYRAYDNTFQPYNGPRQQCYSPYS